MAYIRIYYEFVDKMDNSVQRVTVQHHDANRVMSTVIQGAELSIISVTKCWILVLAHLKVTRLHLY